MDRTTGLTAIVGPPAGAAWYLIVALDDQHNTRGVSLDDGAELVFGRSAEASVVVEHEAVSRCHTAIRRSGEARRSSSRTSAAAAAPRSTAP